MEPAQDVKGFKQDFMKRWTPYFKKRYVLFFIVSIVSLVIPFIRLNENHIFLLSFDRKQLQLMGVAFDMQEFYLMPFLLIMMFMFVFFLTTLGGRVWCGWACPQTIFRAIYRDFIEGWLLGMHSRRNKQKSAKMEKVENKAKKVVAILIWTLLAFVAASNFMWYFIPPEDFFAYMANPSEHMVLLGFVGGVTLFLVYDVVWLAENFCIYVCPYARIQSVMYDNNTIMEIYDDKRGGVIYDQSGHKIADKPSEGDCVGCMACVNVCPTHIDIRKGLQLECINCLECADACAPVMASLGKENLIQWTSYEAMETGKTKIFRFRIIAYIVMLTMAFSGLLLMGSKKEHMLLNINRTTELYAVKDNGIVENHYTFLFQNTDSKEHNYYFEVVGNENIKISRPTEPFKLNAGSKANKVVVLYTDKEIAKNDRKDTPIAIKIRGFAVDDKQKIVVERDAVFFYPSTEVINEKKAK
jgi:cytochrome c oxidase accessory protein FixG